MKIITHYTVDITCSKDVSQEELDRLDKAWKVDELTKRLANDFKHDLQASYPMCDSIVPTAKNIYCGELSMATTKFKKFDTVLSQKTCPYCHEDKEGHVRSNGSFYLYYDRFQGWLIHVGKNRIKPRPIKYCPMCGRKLLPI